MTCIIRTTCGVSANISSFYDFMCKIVQIRVAIRIWFRLLSSFSVQIQTVKWNYVLEESRSKHFFMRWSKTKSLATLLRLSQTSTAGTSLAKPAANNMTPPPLKSSHAAVNPYSVNTCACWTLKSSSLFILAALAECYVVFSLCNVWNLFHRLPNKHCQYYLTVTSTSQALVEKPIQPFPGTFPLWSAERDITSARLTAKLRLYLASLTLTNRTERTLQTPNRKTVTWCNMWTLIDWLLMNIDWLRMNCLKWTKPLRSHCL